MTRRSLPVLLLAGLFAMLCADEQAGKSFSNVGELYADIAVLNVLHILQPTPAQLQALRAAAPKTMQKPPPKKLLKVSEKLRVTMLALREALVADDEQKIDEQFTRYDELREKEQIDFDEVEISDAARELAPELVRTLSARQLALYSASAAEFLDPVGLILQTLEEGRKLRGRRWQQLREDTAYQVGYLLAGLDTQAEEKMRQRVETLLNQAHKLNNREYARQKDDLENQARALLGKLGPADVLRHFMERTIAELLSSHRLEAALELRARRK